jgi:4-hydroxy-tetrahydrodipicolinate synthase
MTNQKSKLKDLDKVLQPLHHSMFVESNPSPVKYAAKILGLCDDAVRLPLVKVTDETKNIVSKALETAKLV